MNEELHIPSQLPKDTPLTDVPDGEYLIVDEYRPKPSRYSLGMRYNDARREFQVAVIRNGQPYGFREYIDGELHIPAREDDAMIGFDVPDIDFPPIA